MSITTRPYDPVSGEILTWYAEGSPIPSHAEVATNTPISSCFDELLGTSSVNPSWASFEAPPGRPSFLLFCLGLCPQIDFEVILKHPTEALMALYLFTEQANKDLSYIHAKMTLKKA